jgi:transposase-like protein
VTCCLGPIRSSPSSDTWRENDAYGGSSLRGDHRDPGSPALGCRVIGRGLFEETLVPGAVVSEVARRHGLTPQQVFIWRCAARKSGKMVPAFVPPVVSPEQTPTLSCTVRCDLEEVRNLPRVNLSPHLQVRREAGGPNNQVVAPTAFDVAKYLDTRPPGVVFFKAYTRSQLGASSTKSRQPTNRRPPDA